MEQLELFKKSWGVHEGFKKLQEQLDERIPLEGSVPSPRSTNKHLEKFRVASNLAYDLFNNGLMNRRSRFGQFFGWVPHSQRGGYYYRDHDWRRFEEKLEPVITQLMQAAAKEQGIRI